MYIKIKGLKINYKIVGDGVPVLLIHGFTVDHRLLRGCMEPIFKDREYKRIYIDLPGMGKSQSSDVIHGSEDVLNILKEFVNKIIPDESFFIVGQSYGGYLSRGLVNSISSRIIGLILICPLAIPDSHSRQLPPHSIVYRDDEFLDTLDSQSRENFTKYNVVLSREVFKRYYREVLAGSKIANSSGLERIRRAYSFKEDVDSSGIEHNFPALILVGKQDSQVGYLDQFKIVSNYSRASYHLIDGAGHNLQIEKVDLFNRVVTDWLKSIEDNISSLVR